MPSVRYNKNMTEFLKLIGGLVLIGIALIGIAFGISRLPGEPPTIPEPIQTEESEKLKSEREALRQEKLELICLKNKGVFTKGGQEVIENTWGRFEGKITLTTCKVGSKIYADYGSKFEYTEYLE